MIGKLYISGCASLTPFASLGDFFTGSETELPKPDLSLLAPTLRRGLSDVTRLFMHTAQAALQEAQVPADAVHVLFASAFGEIGAAEKLIAQAHDENTSSPARFRNSVHNTAAGLYSISTKNLLPSTAIAAGWETVPMGLLEAAGLLTEVADHVLLVFAEERVPEALSKEHQHGPLAVALVLSKHPNERSLACLSNLRRAASSDVERLFSGQNHPLAPSVALATAVRESRSQTLTLSDGERPYCVDISPAQASTQT